jgi:hypothetical protein
MMVSSALCFNLRTGGVSSALALAGYRGRCVSTRRATIGFCSTRTGALVGQCRLSAPDARRVDLICRDEDGVDHLYYAARRVITGEWRELLEEYGEV